MMPLGGEVRAFARTHRDGLRLPLLAPLVPALVVLPELAQHWTEIDLGMFASHKAFRAIGADPERMAYGGVKLLGLFLSILLAARFWANRETGARWWSLAGIAWRPAVSGICIQIAASVLSLAGAGLSPAGAFAVMVLVMVLSLPGLVLLVAGLVGDASVGVGWAYRRGWGKALRILAHIAPFWALAQWVHALDHDLALGAPLWRVWALMVWDAVLVGLMACVAGTALHHGYRGPLLQTES